MRQSITLISLLASTALAQDVVSFYFPGGAEGVDPVATIETANPTTTGMRVACPTGVDSTECGWGYGVEINVISGTIYQGTMSMDQFTMSYNCDHNTKAVEMTCTADMTGEDTETATFSGSEIFFVSATVVKGNDMLKAASTATATATTTAASASTSAASKTDSAASTGMKTSTLTSESGSSSIVKPSQTSGSATTPTGSGSVAQASTGAAAKFGLQGSALLALGGAAAVGFW